MPQADLTRDIREVVNQPPKHISNISSRDSNSVSFTLCYSDHGTAHNLHLELVSIDAEDYPVDSKYFLFTEDADVAEPVLNTVNELQTLLNGLNLLETLQYIVQRLSRTVVIDQTCEGSVISSNNTSVQMSRFDEDTQASDADIANPDDTSNISDLECDSDYGFEFEARRRSSTIQGQGRTSSSVDIDVSKIKSDLRATRDADFRIGVYSDLKVEGVLCLSIQIHKLQMSTDTLRAWNLQDAQYLILLIRFRDGYKTLSQIIETSLSAAKIDMHVALCMRYRPDPAEIRRAFAQSEPDHHPKSTYPSLNNPARKLEPLFIGHPLNELMNKHFDEIVRFRINTGASWAGAEHFHTNNKGRSVEEVDNIMDYISFTDDVQDRALPPVVLSDALVQHTEPLGAPMPLVAMQFLLRHFVRCTEFCLVCHRRLENSFEALKPYVCSNPLCLYQFLSYGFGPPLDHEILTQPLVVDLLVSLCISQASAYCLREFPSGMLLEVPLLATTTAKDAAVTAMNIKESFKGILRAAEMSLDVEEANFQPNKRFRDGEWITVEIGVDGVEHYRIRNVVGYKLYLCDHIVGKEREDNCRSEAGVSTVNCYFHDRPFDDLPENAKAVVIAQMLQCLPPIEKIKQDIMKFRPFHGGDGLRMIKSIPPAAKDILRWVIASNRSCIIQIDDLDTVKVADKVMRKSFEPRIKGMDDSWIQFRFAQGAPDKEQRFIDCVRQHSASREHPTLFAWHGSAPHNWHSIIRQGLNFDRIVHGRSFGNGVYMSSQLQTSLGYCIKGGSNNRTGWLNATLDISQIVSLQEVVNAPSEFVSLDPHLVVKQKDWIQSRYLFVNTKHTTPLLEASPPKYYDQDPRYVAVAFGAHPIDIPVSASFQAYWPLPVAERPATSKRRKTALRAEDEKVVIFIDEESDATVEDDKEWVEPNCVDVAANDVLHEHAVSDSGRRVPACVGSKTKRGLYQAGFVLDADKTDFVPGKLDKTGIQALPAPSDASSAATKALMQAFRATVSTQEQVPLKELGFYIDPDHIDNVYQWIVELHSFDRDLPLSNDLKAAGLTSVVIELRFTDAFPFQPPFVRVVKPRFMPFLQGGGGHVTEGGAMCMELLTGSGWSAANSMESVLLQVRLAISDRDRPARLALRNMPGCALPALDCRPYGIGEAIIAFKRACVKHQWVVPPGMDALNQQG